MVEALQRTLTWLGTQTARPWAFFVIFGYALFWLRYQPDSFDLHAALRPRAVVLVAFLPPVAGVLSRRPFAPMCDLPSASCW